MKNCHKINILFKLLYYNYSFCHVFYLELKLNLADNLWLYFFLQENDLDTRDWTEKCFDTIGIRNPFELRVGELPEEPNYFTCAFRRDKMDK